MKKTNRIIAFVAAVVLACGAIFGSVGLAAAGEGGAGTTVYKSEQDWGNGVTYTNTVSWNSTYGTEESFSVTSAIGSIVKPIVLACDTIFGSMKMDSILSYAKQLGYNVLAAINSDFFSMSTGVPLGIVVEDGIYKSSPEGYPSVVFDETGKAGVVDYTAVQIKMTNLGQSGDNNVTGVDANGAASASSANGEASVNVTGADANDTNATGADENGADDAVSANVTDGSGDASGSGGAVSDNYGKSLTLTHFNKMRQDTGGMYLFDSSFSTVSTRTSTAGWSVKFKILSGSMKTKGTVMLQVEDVYTGSSAVKIGNGYMVLTAADASNLYYQFQKFSVGDVVSLETSCYGNELLENAQWATGSGNIIVKDGAMTDQSSWDSALKSVNPRSALGIKADGTVIYYEIDGRQSGYSKGLTMKQLAQEFIDLGCVTAVNFDGGGSSAMAVKMPGYDDAKVISSPSDGSQRKCATYVMLVVDGTSDSGSGNGGTDSSGSTGSSGNSDSSGISAITLDQAGTVVYQGSSLNLSCKAFDRNYATVAAPADTTMKVAEGYGNINGALYTAGWVAGMEKIELSSESAEVSNMSSVYVTNKLSSTNITANGKSVTSITASRGQQIQFAGTAKYYGRDVVIGNESFAYTLTGDDIAEISKSGLLTVKDDTNGGTATLTIAAGAVVKTVKITVGGIFDDISGHWAEQYILDLYDLGIVSGVSAGKFSPQSEIKRADFMLMLYRNEGSPNEYRSNEDSSNEGSSNEDSSNEAASDVVSQGNSNSDSGNSGDRQDFSDVKDGAYYADAVRWAKSVGIAKGSGNMFRPLDSMTREEAFTFLYRYMNMSDSDNVDDETDADVVIDDGNTIAIDEVGANAAAGEAVTVVEGDAPRADDAVTAGEDEAVVAAGEDGANAAALIESFKDGAEISSYAIESIASLVNDGIVSGSNGRLRPKAKLTRAEMCKILYMAINVGR